MNFEELKNSDALKKWVVVISCIVISFFIVESFITLSSFNMIVENLKVGDIKNELQDQNEINKKDRNEFEKHIMEAKENIIKKSKDFDEALDKFSDDYNNSLNEASIHMEEDEKNRANASEMNDQAFMESLAKQQKSYKALEKNFLNVMTRRANEMDSVGVNCVIESRQIIRCEKLLYGYTTFNPKHPCDYHPFANGLPKICLEEKKRDYE